MPEGYTPVDSGAVKRGGREELTPGEYVRNDGAVDIGLLRLYATELL